MTSLIEENGKAIGQAVRDVGGAFCGALVSIAKDIQTLGQDTIKAASLEKQSEEFKIGEIVLSSPLKDAPEDVPMIRVRDGRGWMPP